MPPSARNLQTVRVSQLASAIGPRDGEHVAIVGGGGKTTTLFALGAQLGPTSVMTTTTRMGSERSEGHRVLLRPTHPELRTAIAEHNRVVVWDGTTGRRADGVDPSACDEWFADDIVDHVIIEADGSRGRPFKAPAAHEPVIPTSSTLVIACIGAQSLGRPIDEVCHRPEQVAALAEGSVRDLLTPERAARVLLSDQGSRKRVPVTARFLVLVHRVEPTNAAATMDLLQLLKGQAHAIAVEPVETDQPDPNAISSSARR